jgi:hypothetical protein
LKIKRIPILKGQYLLESIENWAFMQGAIFGVILEATIVLDQLRIHLPGNPRPLMVGRILETVSLQGTFSNREVKLRICVTDADGKLQGGRLDYKSRLMQDGLVTVAYWPSEAAPTDVFFSSIAAENQ